MVDVEATRTRGKRANTIVTCTAFFFVGAGCGWFPVDALFNLVANEPQFQENVDEWSAQIMLLGGVIGIVQSGVYLLFKLKHPDRLSLQAEQRLMLLLIAATNVSIALLAGAWHVGAPHYPVMFLVIVFTFLTVNSTYYLFFPLLATHYAGWLIAPVRAGTDLSTLITSSLGELQNPTGSKNLFPSYVLLSSYLLPTSLGLLAWLFIVRFDIALRGPEKDAELSPPSDKATIQRSRSDIVIDDMLAKLARGLACPRSMLMPVVCGTITDVLQWGVFPTLSSVGAQMTDPSGCSGEDGMWVYRQAMTANRILVPLGSMLSTTGACPKGLFCFLSVFQILCSVLMLMAVFGYWRELWMTQAGQLVYIACYACVGLLEGYILTMAYRYIGDHTGLSMEMKKSTSSLLSLVNVLLFCFAGIIFGSLAHSGNIDCWDP